MTILLKLGRRVINIDLVCEIEDYDDHMRLFYAVSSSDSAGVQQQSYADLDGPAADALRTWLAAHTTELVVDEKERAETLSDLDAATERARLLQAAAATADAPEQAPANDNPYYGVARLKQLHGVGSDTETE